MTPAELMQRVYQHACRHESIIRSLSAVIRTAQRCLASGREVPVDELKERLARMQARLQRNAAQFVADVEELDMRSVPEEHRGTVIDAMLAARSVAAGENA
jgi:hypothetical protein